MLVTLILIAIALIAFFIACYYTYTIAFYSPPRGSGSVETDMTGPQYEKTSGRIKAAIDSMAAIPFEEVRITSFDGLCLYGRYYHVRDNAPVVLLFHGYRSTAERDDCGGHALARKFGFNALAVDQRAHGKSDGSTITFGVLERRDCKSWADYAAQRFGNVPILLSGLSMGAATVLMAADLDLPENVVGIMADCPYSSPKAIIRKVCRDMHFPPTLAWPLARCAARIFGKFPIDGSSAEDAVRRSCLPILLIHGEDDRFVPCDMSREIARACRCPVTLHTFPEAGHGLCYITDCPRYEQVTLSFLRSIPALQAHLSETG